MALTEAEVTRQAERVERLLATLPVRERLMACRPEAVEAKSYVLVGTQLIVLVLFDVIVDNAPPGCGTAFAKSASLTEFWLKQATDDELLSKLAFDLDVACDAIAACEFRKVRGAR